MSAGRGATARLQQFGILFGSDRVVLYVEPREPEDRELSPTTSRSELRLGGDPLPYAEWAAEFRGMMPKPLSDHMERVSAPAQGRDHSTAIAERLDTVWDLYRLSRYERPARGNDPRPSGTKRPRGTPPVGPAPDRDRTQDARPANTAPKPADESEDDDLLDAMTGKQRRRTASRKPEVAPPRIVWISAGDGTRSEGFLEDRAAHYFPDQNVLQINGDFRGFTDLIAHWCKSYPAQKPTVIDVVREWSEQILVEVIIGSRSLQGERRWSPTDLAAMRSEEALTGVVFARYHTFNSIRRALYGKLGKPTSSPR
jgi:hypothetical protein